MPPLHGAAGLLDELLAFGIVLALIVALFFGSALRGSKGDPATDDAKPKDEDAPK